MRPIGVTDDFFDLGGHSLLAVRLAARIEEQFGRSLALSDLLLGSTIEELAARIREPPDREWSRRSSILAPRGQAGRSTSCIRSAAASSAITRWPADSMGRVPFFGLQAAGFEGEAEPETDLGAHGITIRRRPSRGIVRRALHPGRMVDGGHRGVRDGHASSPRRGMTCRSSF